MRRPIFIVGANRSGTTLLRLILNAHSQIAIPDELVYFRGICFHRAASNWRRTPLSSEDYDEFVRQFLDRNRETLAPLDAEELHREIVTRGGGDMRLPYQHVLESWARAHGKRRWGEKTPGNVFYAGDIKEFFPDAIFINMVRDPRAGVHSMQRATIFSTDPVINALNRDHYVVAGMKELERHVLASDRMTLRYEDLVADPVATVENVCSFVDVPFEDEMLAFHKTASQYMVVRASADINSAAQKPVQRHKAEAWRSQMSARDIGIVEYICRQHMEDHGYDIVNHSPGPADQAVIAVKTAYWKHQMRKHRQIPDFQIMHGFLPRFRRGAQAGQSTTAS